MCLKLCTLNFQIFVFSSYMLAHAHLPSPQKSHQPLVPKTFLALEVFILALLKLGLLSCTVLKKSVTFLDYSKFCLISFLHNEESKQLKQAAIPMFCKFSPHKSCVGFVKWNCLCEIKQAAIHFTRDIFSRTAFEDSSQDRKVSRACSNAPNRNFCKISKRCCLGKIEACELFQVIAAFISSCVDQ